MKNHRFVGTSISEAFWKDFGMVLGDQNPRFSDFFYDFSKQISKTISEGPKIDKKVLKTKVGHILGPARRNVRSPGER